MHTLLGYEVQWVVMLMSGELCDTQPNLPAIPAFYRHGGRDKAKDEG